MSNYIDFDTVAVPQKKTLPNTTPVQPNAQAQPVSSVPSAKQQAVAQPVESQPIEAEPSPPARPVKQAKPKKKPVKTDVQGVYLRNFPASLVAEAKRVFPLATSQTDAVAALLAVKTGVADGLSPSVLSLMQTYKESDKTKMTLDNIDVRLAHLEHKAVDNEHLTKELELACMYLIFDYLGYRKESVPASSRDVNFLESGVTDMIHRMREQAAQLEREEKQKNGRPKY